MAKEQHIILKWTVDEKQIISLHADINCQPSSAALILSQIFKNNPALAKAFVECDTSNYSSLPVERTFQ